MTAWLWGEPQDGLRLPSAPRGLARRAGCPIIGGDEI